MHMNPDAEQYVLGCILMDDSLLRETCLTVEHFAIQRHQDIYRRMRELEKRGERVDYLSVSQNDVETAKMLAGSVPTLRLFQHYEKLVVDAWKRRKAVDIAEKLQRAIDETEDPNNITLAIRELTQLEESGIDTEYNFGERVMTVLEEIQNNDGTMKGISTGLSDLNTYLHGWQDGDLVIIGARPSVGKTAFVLNSMLYAAQQGVVCTLFALEMEDKANIRRMISAYGNIDATELRMVNKKDYKPDNEIWGKLSRTGSDLASLNINIYDKPNITSVDVRTKVRAIKNRYPNDKHLVIVDYLQLMRGANPREKKVDQMGEISRDLKLLAREFKLPVIALSQLNRGSDSRQDKRPMMSDIRDSGNIEQDADVILLLYRDDYYDAETDRRNIVEVNVAKQRNGRTGKVEVVFLKETNRFVDLARP